ncbi:MAG: hypothetical protein JWR18_2742, partial [Segetibacter sp.]|nr:hypothetical protein [Segetibacter sp.]
FLSILSQPGQLILFLPFLMELAKKYCQSCHPLPGPESLDGKTWEKGVLSAMGPDFDWRQGPPFLVLKNTGKKG